MKDATWNGLSLAAIVAILVMLYGLTTVQQGLYEVEGELWTITTRGLPACIDVDPPVDWPSGAEWRELWWRFREIGKMPISRSKRVIVGTEAAVRPPPNPRRYAKGPLEMVFRWWQVTRAKRVATFAA